MNLLKEATRLKLSIMCNNDNSLDRRELIKRGIGHLTAFSSVMAFGCNRAKDQKPAVSQENHSGDRMGADRAELVGQPAKMMTQSEAFELLGLGVSLAGAEFGTEVSDFSNVRPGLNRKHYFYNSQETIKKFLDFGFQTIRLPFRWERIQPNLGEALRQVELNHLEQTANWVAQHDGGLVLDLHNYGRFQMSLDGQPTTLKVDVPYKQVKQLTRDHLADLWKRLATHFRNHPGVVAYAIMNEPHDMRPANWKQISQHVVSSIRQVDKATTIIVPGDCWSNATEYAEHNGKQDWIRDPTGRIIYEAHAYFDKDGTGKYHTAETNPAHGHDRAQRSIDDFLQWTESNQVAGWIGEFGMPSNSTEWIPTLEYFSQRLIAKKVPACYWAGGEWWGNYPLSIQPTTNGSWPLIAKKMKTFWAI